jgi:CPA2 family monovalent cation:H+ antiporter-2
VRRILLQAFVNLCLVAAIFGAGAYLARHYRESIAQWIPYPQVSNALIWGGALVLSLAFLIAAYRKLKALAMLLAEVGVRAGRHTARVQRIVAEVLPAVSIGAMLVLVSALSSSILPPAELLVAVLGMAGVILILLWRTLVKLHSRLQIALLETLQSEKDAP